MGSKEVTKCGEGRYSPLWLEYQKRAKDDPELAKQLEAAMSVIERNSDTLQRLADF